MSTEVLSQSIQAGGTAIFGSGTQFLIVTAVNPVTVVAKSIGNSNKNRTFTNVPAGFKFTADSEDDGFDVLIVSSATTQTISLAVGTDDVTYSNSVTVTGSVATVETPMQALSDLAPVSAVATAVTPVVPVNATRRVVTLTVDPLYSGGLVYAQKAGGAQDLLPMQAGIAYKFSGTYGVSVHNPNATAANVYIVEES
jgi:hypothetical protein